MNSIDFLRALSAAALLAAVGCGPQDSTGVGNPGLTQDEQALVTDGNDSDSAGDIASSIMSVPLLAITSDKEITTADVAAGTATFSTKFFTSGCVTADRAVGVVTYTFTNCAGPFGFAQANGKLIATFTVKSAGSLDLDLTSDGFTVNSTPVTETGHATVTFTSPTTKQTVWTGSFEGRTPKGRPVHHDAAYTIGYDTVSSCVSLDGSATTTVDLALPKLEHGVTTTIAGYVRCGKRTVCPNSGVVDVVNLVPGAKVHDVHVMFLGGPSAAVTVTRPEGKKTFTIPLTCD